MKQPALHSPALHTCAPPQLVPSLSRGCAQVPAASHASPVQGLPSSGQLVPPGLFTTVQPPLPSHVELASQLVAVHVYAAPVQTPPVHTSLWVQALPSVQTLPSALLGVE